MLALAIAPAGSTPRLPRCSTRRAVLLGGVAAGLCRPSRLSASTADEVAQVLLEPWDPEPDFGKGAWRRLDETDDSLFYDKPKLVYHIDDAAVQAATRYYAQSFKELAMSAASNALRGGHQ